ncbi:MAG: SGNH/GDSL hydrolase family protein [Deltaproteobacteria bacterium]|nr:SGNH/GDSL hydrolase family protein [Deltaproteobacteria bacterium]
MPQAKTHKPRFFGLAYLAIAALVLFGADRLAASWAHREIASGRFSFAKSSVALADEFLAYAAASPSPTAVFLGDSVVRGAHQSAEHALPALLESRLRAATDAAWTVHNFGLTAANNSDKLILLRRLVLDRGARPDLVVVADNIKFYSEAFAVQTARYPALVTSEMWERDGDYYASRLGLARPAERALWPAPERAARRLATHFFLFANREDIAARLTGDHPVRLGLAAVNRVRRTFAGEGEDKVRKESDRRHFRVPPENIEPDALNIRALAEIAALCRERSIPLFVYLTPLDLTHGLASQAFDLKTLARFAESARDAADLPAGRFFVLYTLLKDGMFRDLDHPTDEGLALLADALTERIAETLP